MAHELSNYSGFGAEITDNILQNMRESEYIDPVAAEGARLASGLPSLDQKAYAEWVTNLSDDDRSRLDAQRARFQGEQTRVQATHDRLTTTVPELYQAQLPASIEAKLGGKRYALGFNQTQAETVGEATDYLSTENGIDFTGYHLSHRFLMFDQSTSTSLGKDHPSDIGDAIDKGFYNNPQLGRFVAAFPEEHPEASTGERLITDVNDDTVSILPYDAIVRDAAPGQRTRKVFNAKYIAGFIDGDGVFWENKNFAQSSEPQFVKYVPEAGAETQKHGRVAEKTGTLAVKPEVSAEPEFERAKQLAEMFLTKAVANNKPGSPGRERLDQLLTAVQNGDHGTVADIERIRHEVKHMRQQAKQNGVADDKVEGAIVDAYKQAVKQIEAKPPQDRDQKDMRTLMRAMIVMDANGVTPSLIPKDLLRRRLEKAGLYKAEPAYRLP